MLWRLRIRAPVQVLLLLATLLLAGADRHAGPGIVASSGTAPSRHTSNTSALASRSFADKHYSELHRRLFACTTGDQIFRTCEVIPAIKQSVDKARKIIVASEDDAELARFALVKLANITRHSELEAHVWSPACLNSDRRVQQLQDCVELQVSRLSLASINEYVRALVVLHLEDDEHFLALWKQYARVGESLSADELIDAFWTLALFHETRSKRSDLLQSLQNKLVLLISKSLASDSSLLKHPFLHPSLSIRLISSLGMLGVHDEALEDYCLLSLAKNVKYLSAIKCYRLLIAVLKLKRFNEAALINHLLVRIAADLRAGQYRVIEVRTIAQSVLSLYKEITSDDGLQSLRGSILGLGNQLVESVMSMEYLDLTSLAYVLRTSSYLQITTPGLWSLLSSAMRANFASNVTMPVVDAALVLESIAATYPSDQLKERGVPPEMLTVAGRLSTVCMTHNARLDVSSLINACWAISELGYPYQALLRSLRKRVQFKLAELSPNALSKLVLSIFMEERSSLELLKGIGAKYDRDFVNQVRVRPCYIARLTALTSQVILNTIRRFNEIPRITDRAKVLIAVGSLGRIALLGNNAPRLELQATEISTLSTQTLVTLLWAVSRLKRGLLSDDTIDTLKLELSKRAFAPPLVSADTVLLFARALGNTRACDDDTFKNLYGFAAAHLCKYLQTENVDETGAFILTSPEPFSSRLATLCESIEALLDLDWYDGGVDELARSFSSYCAVNTFYSFDQGRLLELAVLYRELQAKLKKSRSLFGYVKQIFSKVD